MFEGTRACIACTLAAVFAPACILPNPEFDDAATEGQVDGDGDGDGDPNSTQPGDGDADTNTGGTCGPELEDCAGVCVSLDEDPLNCGSCGYECPPMFVCEVGDCVEVKSEPRVVFVSSKTYSGAFGGLDGANAICQELAANLPGDFKAWLGVGPNGPATTFNKDGHFVLVDGTIIANSWADLTDGNLLHPISLDESGQQAESATICDGGSSAVWTGVTITGETLTSNCAGWTVADAEGGVGYLKSMDASWTAAPMCGAVCTSELPIYCFEQ